MKGVKYFQCKFNYGIFVHAEKVIVVEDGDIDSGKGKLYKACIYDGKKVWIFKNF